MKRRIWLGLGRLALLAALVVAVAAISRLAIDRRLAVRNQSLSDELGRVRSENKRLKRRIKLFQGDIRRLRADEAEVVRHARTTLGMVRPGEVVYHFGQPGRRRESAGASR